jgi:hypothetical protein
MKRESAKEINQLMMEFSKKLNDSIFLVDKTNIQEYNQYRLAIGQIMGTMLLEIMNPIYKQYPDLEPKELKAE